MTHPETGSHEELGALLEARRRYEQWLAQLEERRAASPAHVLARVREDYLRRLDGVMRQLSGRASELEASASVLRGRIATLQDDEERHRDERAETELRGVVGEYAPEDADASIAACDEAIALLSAERADLERELSHINELLAQITPPTPADAPDPVHAVDRLVDAVFDDNAGEEEELDAEPSGTVPARGEEAGTSGARSGGLPAPTPSTAEELAFLQSLVEPSDDAQSGLDDDRGSSAAPRPDTDTGDLLPPPLLAAPRRQPTPMAMPPQHGGIGGAGGGKLSSLTPGSIPSFFKDMPTEAVKTLKCQECGTMNYPTEWYCERCGGELAAM